MKKKSKIIICILCLIIGLLLIGGTIFFTKNNLSTSTSNGMPSGMPNNSNMTPPSGSNSTDSMTPPDMPSDNGNSGNSTARPQRPSTDNSTDDTNSMPDKNTTNNGRTNNKQEMMTTNITSLTILQIALICIGALLFSLGIVYLIMSLGGTNNIFVSFGIIYRQLEPKLMDPGKKFLSTQRKHQSSLFGYFKADMTG